MRPTMASDDSAVKRVSRPPAPLRRAAKYGGPAVQATVESHDLMDSSVSPPLTVGWEWLKAFRGPVFWSENT